MIDSIENIINSVKSKLPSQGPLEYFVHHNTLAHYQHLNFFKATKIAAFEYNANAFMSEFYYIDEYEKGNISKNIFFETCEDYIGKHNLKITPEFLMELLCAQQSKAVKLSPPERQLQQQYFQSKNVYFDKLYQKNFGVDVTYKPKSHVLRFFAAYFDYGSSYWVMPDRIAGLWCSFCRFFEKSTIFDNRYLKKLSKFIQHNKNFYSQDVILKILLLLNLKNESDIEEYLFSLALRYKGWGGFIKSILTHPDWVKRSDIVPSFSEYLCILVVCEYIAITLQKNQLGKVPEKECIYEHSDSFIASYHELMLNHSDIQEDILNALPFLTNKDREGIWHKAFEKTFDQQCIDVYASNQENRSTKNCFEPIYQVICCIDDREESFRRYLEIDPECETFSYAGHFGLNISFKGFFDKHYRNLCPVGESAEYTIIEKPVSVKKTALKALILMGEMQWISALSSKRMLSSVINTFAGFFTQIIPLTLDIISPKLTCWIKNLFVKHVNNIVVTQLIYKEEDIKTGVPFNKRVEIARNFIKTIGLNQQFSNYIFIMGHGSSSLNNPHESAHDCGACGGGRGGPNARLMAKILNEKAIRDSLKSFNILIPDYTVFIGAYHNTCSDAITLYSINNDLRAKLSEILQRINQAVHFDAKERCRKFMMIPFGKKPSYYLKKVQERSIDLRQPRPEYGHATNSVCIIGPRAYTKDIFYDRNAFLISYDPHNDSNGFYLKSVLSAAIPVCAGINLEYYFSFIDNERYGCGTKLPHNITSLIGVMNGFQSDLQLGLPWQMVEIHKPVRLFTLVICRLTTMLQLLESKQEYVQIIKNNWINFYVFNLDDRNIYHFDSGKFSISTTNSNSTSIFYDRIDKGILNTHKPCPFGLIKSC